MLRRDRAFPGWAFSVILQTGQGLTGTGSLLARCVRVFLDICIRMCFSSPDHQSKRDRRRCAGYVTATAWYT